MRKSEFFISLILITVLILTCYIIFRERSNNSNINLALDTVYVNKYIFDTLTKFQEKIIYKKLKPEPIRIIKTDTIKLPEEVIISAEKNNEKLKVISFNLNDSIFKEYDIPEINQDFKLRSDGKGLSIESKKFDFSGLNIFTGIEYNFKDKTEKVNYIFGIETGIRIKSNYEISFGVQYNKAGENIMGILKLKYKL